MPCLLSAAHGAGRPDGRFRTVARIARRSAAVRALSRAFPCAWPIDALIQALKYRGQLAIGRVLGALLAPAVRTASALHRDVRLSSCPCPCTRHGMRSAASTSRHEIARWTARVLDLGLRWPGRAPCADTRPQVGLSRRGARAQNLRGAFAADARVSRAGAVAVVDDVMTTGSTASRAAAALRCARRARSVDVWCVARADRDRRTGRLERTRYN